MNRRDLGLRRSRLLSAPLVAILLTALLGCESARQPSPAPAKTSSSTRSARPTAQDNDSTSSRKASETGPIGQTASTGDLTVDGARETADDAAPTVLRAPKVTVFDPESPTEEPEADAVAVDRGDPDENSGLPQREDLNEDALPPDDEDADVGVVAGDAPAANEPPNFTVGADALHVPTDDLKRLHELYNVWVNPQTKQVVMSAEVCRREGALEMFACLKHTKEHESVLSVYTEAFIVHAGLMAVGAEPGKPVEFQPQYRPAEGQEIEIAVFWEDAKGKIRRARGQDWVRDIRTKEPLAHPWVFGGSGFWKDPNTGREQYLAEYGDFICVSNFSSAMIDLPIESSQSEAGLLFEPFTERIPPTGSRVTLVLTPKVDKPVEKAAEETNSQATTGIERHDL